MAVVYDIKAYVLVEMLFRSFLTSNLTIPFPPPPPPRFPFRGWLGGLHIRPCYPGS